MPPDKWDTDVHQIRQARLAAEEAAWNRIHEAIERANEALREHIRLRREAGMERAA